MLGLARLHAASAGTESTVRFVAFVNEEPPYLYGRWCVSCSGR
jgi:hypothetical protein